MRWSSAGSRSQAPAPGRIALEEEGWLDEALAHLAEDLHGFSRSNIDYRDQRLPVAARTLPARRGGLLRGRPVPEPRQSRVHVPVPALVRRPVRAGAAAGAGRVAARRVSRTWRRRRGARSPNCFAGGRWRCSERSGSRPRRSGPRGAGIDRSNMRGRWRTGSSPARGPLASWRAARRNAGTQAGPAAISSSSGVARGRREVKVSGPAEAELQVTVVPLPADMARLELTGPDQRPGRRRAQAAGLDREGRGRARPAVRAGLGAVDPLGRPSRARVPAAASSTCWGSPPASGPRPCRRRRTDSVSRPIRSERRPPRNRAAGHQAHRHGRPGPPRRRLGRGQRAAVGNEPPEITGRWRNDADRERRAVAHAHPRSLRITCPEDRPSSMMSPDLMRRSGNADSPSIRTSSAQPSPTRLGERLRDASSAAERRRSK